MKTADATVLGAIDVGTNAARLKIVRVQPDGAFLPLHEERAPVRPGEGVFNSGVMRKAVADRLVATLERFGAVCKEHGAVLRAVATSALREARNQDEILARIKRDCGIELEVVSGREEARLICLGVLRGKPAQRRSLVMDVGGGSTEVVSAKGETPLQLWSVPLGAVRLSELFDTRFALDDQQLKVMREYAARSVAQALPEGIDRAPSAALGSSGSIRALVGYAATPGTAFATRRQIVRSVKQLSAMSLAERGAHFDPSRSEVILAGAVIVEATMKALQLESIAAVPSGLRDGILVDMWRGS